MFRIVILFSIFFICYLQFYSMKSLNLGDNTINQINNPDKDSFENMISKKQPLVVTNVLGELSFTEDEVNERDNKGLKNKVQNYFKYYFVPLSYEKNIKIVFDKKDQATSLVKQVHQRMFISVITGIKKIILFNPDQIKYLYRSRINPNKSEVNFWKFSEHVFPDFPKSNYTEIIIRENQMICIPYGWWWTSISDTECLSVNCFNDSIFSYIFKKIDLLK